MKNDMVVKNGFAQIFVLLGMLAVSIALPVATKLVQQNQENRSNAASTQCESGDTKCEGGYKYTCSSYKWKKTTTTCSSSSVTKICTPNARKCVGTIAYVCNTLGSKWNTTQCGTIGCSAGKCNTASTTAPKTCTYTCTWSACKADSSSLTGGTQTCTAETKSPSGCTGGTSKKGTTRNCTPAKTASTKTTTKTTCSYICTKWDTCSSGWQTCTTDSKLSTSQPNCTGGRKIGTRQKCTTNPTVTKKADGSTCGSNSECTSGYCNLTIKKCATKVIPCTYICKKWSTCTNGKQTCIEDKKVTATACSGGRKVNTTQNCKTTTTSKMWYYFNGTSCVGKSYASVNDCISANKACFSTYDVCAKNNTPSSSSKTTTYYYYDESKKTCTPTTSLNACKSITCYSALPSCQENHIKMWYYFNGTSCVGKAYGSSDACTLANKACYANYNACLKANPPSSLTSDYWYYKEGTGCVETSRISCQSLTCYSSKILCELGHKDKITVYYIYDGSKCTPVTSLSICQTATCYSSIATCQLGNSKLPYYYYSGSCKSAGSYISQSACQTDHGGVTCYSSFYNCKLAHPIFACNASTVGNLRCSGNILQKCFYVAGDTGNGWGTYRDCGTVGCNIVTNACNSNECTTGEVSCASDVLKYCGGTGTWIIRTCPYGCNRDKTACNTQSNIVSCTSKGGSCVLSTKCDKKKNHVIYAYVKSNTEIRAVGGCSSDQVCCVANEVANASCIAGDIECRNHVVGKDKKVWKYNYEVYECISDKMTATGRFCTVSEDKVVYGANPPEGWSNIKGTDNRPIVEPNKDITEKQNALMEVIDAAGGERTREGVAAAALYLSEEFGYRVPYYHNGGIDTGEPSYKITNRGFQYVTNRGGTPYYVTPWGTVVDEDNGDRNLAGLNCTGFVDWAYRADGFMVGNSNESVRIDLRNKGGIKASDSNKKKIVDTIKIGDMVYSPEQVIDGNKSKHVGIITGIDYASGTIQVVQSSPEIGVNTVYLDMFTLKRKDGKGDSSFTEYTHVDDSFFENDESTNATYNPDYKKK